MDPLPKGGKGGKGGRGSRDREPPSRDVQISKKLSWLLRHGAEAENVQLDTAGYANLHDVINNRKLRGMKISFGEVKEVVDGNEKQRFGMKLCEGAAETSQAPKDWLIRANQGHSIKVAESEGLLTPVVVEEGKELPAMVVHGTSRAAWVEIVESGGLKTMGRNHIHFASGLPDSVKPLAAPTSDTNGTAETSTTEPAVAEPPVISGMRATSTILIYLDLAAGLAAGLKFWRSENGVILSEGDEAGQIGLQFFKRAEDRKGEGVLAEEGKIVKDAPADWRAKGGFKPRR